MSDDDRRGRKLLKQQGNVQFTQESFEAPRGRQAFRYFVGLADGPAQSFDTPHAAWDHFQKLAGLHEHGRGGDTTKPV
jgi:hypothetical protein